MIMITVLLSFLSFQAQLG